MTPTPNSHFLASFFFRQTNFTKTRVVIFVTTIDSSGKTLVFTCKYVLPSVDKFRPLHDTPTYAFVREFCLRAHTLHSRLSKCLRSLPPKYTKK